MVPLEQRTFHLKNPVLAFFCPLCRTRRAFAVHYKLNVGHYFKIVVSTLFLTFFLWPWVGIKSLFFLFPLWALVEGCLRILWRGGVPCPHCGFDASWYKTDVRVAKKKVKEFWGSSVKRPNGSI